MNTRKLLLMAALAVLVAPLAARAVSPADWSAPLSARAALHEAPAQGVAGDAATGRSLPDRRFLLDEAHGLTSWTVKPGTMNAAEPATGSDLDPGAPASWHEALSARQHVVQPRS